MAFIKQFISLLLVSSLFGTGLRPIYDAEITEPIPAVLEEAAPDIAETIIAQPEQTEPVVEEPSVISEPEIVQPQTAPEPEVIPDPEPQPEPEISPVVETEEQTAAIPKPDAAETAEKKPEVSDNDAKAQGEDIPVTPRIPVHQLELDFAWVEIENHPEIEQLDLTLTEFKEKQIEEFEQKIRDQVDDDKTTYTLWVPLEIKMVDEENHAVELTDKHTITITLKEALILEEEERIEIYTVLDNGTLKQIDEKDLSLERHGDQINRLMIDTACRETILITRAHPVSEKPQEKEYKNKQQEQAGNPAQKQEETSELENEITEESLEEVQETDPYQKEEEKPEKDLNEEEFEKNKNEDEDSSKDKDKDKAEKEADKDRDKAETEADKDKDKADKEDVKKIRKQLKASLNKKMELTASGLMPEDSRLLAQVLDGEKLLRAAQILEIDPKEHGLVFALDISLQNGQDEPAQLDEALQLSLMQEELKEISSEQVNIQVFHIEESSPENPEGNGSIEKVDAAMDDESRIVFEARSFSVYTFVVDFYYKDFEVHLEGKGEILLSELMKQLSIAEEPENIADVTFTNPDLIRIDKRNNGDWKLTSLMAFTSEEWLTITCFNGTVYEIRVLDFMPVPPANVKVIDCLDLQEAINAVDVYVLEQDLLVEANRGQNGVLIKGKRVLDLNGHVIYSQVPDSLFVVGNSDTANQNATFIVQDSKANESVHIVQEVDENPYGHLAQLIQGVDIVNVSMQDRADGPDVWSGPAENYLAMFDGKTETRAVTQSGYGGSFVFTFQTNAAVSPAGYKLINPGDAASHPERLPAGWKLEASSDNETWTLLDEKDNTTQTFLKAEDDGVFTGNLSPGQPYSYYRLTIECDAGFQLSQFELLTPDMESETTLIYYETVPQISGEYNHRTTDHLIRHEIRNAGMILGMGMSAGDTQSRAFWVNHSTLIIESGIVANFRMGEGPGIRASNSSTVEIKGGIFAGSRNTKGTVLIFNSSLSMSGGSISGNAGAYGGGLFIKGSRARITGGIISNNTSDNEGGGLFIEDSSTLDITGDVVVSGNQSHLRGGGLYAHSNSVVTMDSGFFSSNAAITMEGGGMAYSGATFYIQNALDSAVYLTNNHTFTPNDWGGGAIFIREKEGIENSNKSYATTGYIYNALITENTAEGFGGGFGGCSTGKINITGQNGAAIFGNSAAGLESGLSSDASSKRDDLRVFQNDIFMANGYQDYFCARASVITTTMLGGSSARWQGTADGYPVQREEVGELLAASDYMGLSAHPTRAAMQAAYNTAGVYITGNTSSKHGGGIMCNGYLIVGNTEEFTTGSVLSINASKQVDHNGTLEKPGDQSFSFEIQSLLGQRVARGTSDANVPITFLTSLSFDITNCSELSTGQSKEFHYIMLEHDDSIEGYVYDPSRYDIAVTVKKVEKQTELKADAGGAIKHYWFAIEQVDVTYISGNEETNVLHQVFDIDTAFNSDLENHAAEITIHKPDGKAAFINVKTDSMNVRVEKHWLQEDADHPQTIQVQLEENGMAREDPVILSPDNGYSYEWTNLSTDASYDVKEIEPEGYSAIYDVTRMEVNDVETLVVDITNIPRDENQLTIKKVDGFNPDIPIPDVKFELRDANGNLMRFTGTNNIYQIADDSSDPLQTTTTLITNKRGAFVITNLPSQTYTLTEIEAAPGFVLLKDDLGIEINHQDVEMTIKNYRASQPMPGMGGSGNHFLMRAYGITALSGMAYVLISEMKLRNKSKESKE